MSSVAFDKIVPFGQYFVLDDMLPTLALKERVAFFLCLIYVSVDSRKYSESLLGSCLGRHIAGLLDGVEDAVADFETGKVKVELDSDKVSDADLSGAVDEAGFKML